MEEFHRIRRLPPYVFESVNRAKAAARNAGADIIDLGMGNPDLPTPAHVIEKMRETIGRPRTDRYSSSKGIPGLRRAQAAYYARRFGVKLNPDTQVVTTLGSKEGFANVAQAITAPGDVVLVPNPSYPIHAFGFLDGRQGYPLKSSEPTPHPSFIRGARACLHPLDPEAARTRRLLSREPDRLCGRSRFLSRRRRVREEAQSHRAVGLGVFGGLLRRQPAALAAAGAGRDGRRGRVRTSLLPKTLLDAGLAYRLSCLRSATHGTPGALTRVKSYLDYGAFTPVQVAATAALNGPDDCIVEMRETYKHRRDVLVESFGRAGWDIPAPRASITACSEAGSEGFRTSRLASSIRDAPGRQGRDRRVTGHRLRRAWRRPRAHRARRERAAHPPGRPQPAPVP